MQMINVLKRLAELDAKNPRMVKENFAQEDAFNPAALTHGVEEFGTFKVANIIKQAVERNEIGEEEAQQALAALAQQYQTSTGNPPPEGVFDLSLVGDTPPDDTGSNISKPNFDVDGQEDELGEESLETDVDECGVPVGGEGPSTPASISITAGSGEELGSMLKTIMTLAGVHQYGGEEPAISAEPTTAEPSKDSGDVDGTQSMRSVIDKLNPSGGEEGDEEEGDEEEEVGEMIDSMGREPNNYRMSDDALSNTDMHNHEPAGSTRAPNRSTFQPNAISFESLMKDYEKFVSESKKLKEESIPKRVKPAYRAPYNFPKISDFGYKGDEDPEWHKSQQSQDFDKAFDTSLNTYNTAKIKHAGVRPEDFMMTDQIKNPFYSPDGTDDESDPDYEEDLIDVGINYEAHSEGHYSPSTWGYHGGEEEEFPEFIVDKLEVVDLSSGEDILKHLSSEQVSSIENDIMKHMEFDPHQRKPSRLRNVPDDY